MPEQEERKKESGARKIWSKLFRWEGALPTFSLLTARTPLAPQISINQETRKVGNKIEWGTFESHLVAELGGMPSTLNTAIPPNFMHLGSFLYRISFIEFIRFYKIIFRIDKWLINIVI